MEISSHYYALLALCRTHGIPKEEAYTIAYASQFVDDAKINYLFVNMDEREDVLFVKNDDESVCIKHIATCHSYFKIKTYNITSMFYNTSAFHFIPGCQGEYFTKKLVCKENSNVINDILSNNLNVSSEKFGMLLHIYADTFAHQGFSGLLSKENIIENLDHKNGTFMIKLEKMRTKISNFFINLISSDKDMKFKNIIPAYGHGQAYHYPDLPYLQWSYNYNNETHENASIETIDVDNRQRYKKAFLSIASYLERYMQMKGLTPQLYHQDTRENFYEILAKKESNKKKIKLWRQYLVEYGYFDKNDKALFYDEDAWLKESFNDFSQEKYQARVVNDAQFVEDYREKSWYKFCVAVKEYKLELVEELKSKGIEIPK